MELRMHGWTRLATFAPLALVATLAGCNNDTKMNQQALLDENRDLRAELDRTRTNLDDADARAMRAETELGDARQKLSDAAAQPPLPENSSGATWSERDGQPVVDIEGDVLFDSGQHDLKKNAQTTLRSIAGQIKTEYPGSSIRIDGFTDTDRIKTKKYDSNYHLGFERAFAVGQYLMKQGLGRDRISYGSFGPHVPRGTKAESRRVEITIIE
jgi:flagellar motor protein MotB